MDLREAVYQELFLDLYGKWRVGHYSSHFGLIRIGDMNTKHIENAIKKLFKDRQIRYEQVMKLVSDGDVIEAIQNSYENGRDLFSLKLQELEQELATRSVQ